MEENFDTFQTQTPNLDIKGTLPTKFMKELNFRENQKLRRQKRKVQVNVISKLRELVSGQPNQKEKKKTFKKSFKMQECWMDGAKIIGQKKGGQWHGEISIYYPNGAKFTGKYHHGVRIYGNFDFNNGYIYNGGFLGDKFNGEGTITIPSGKSVKGDWKDNQIQGKANIQYPTGQIYYGQTLNFKKHGHGYLFLNGGYKYVGYFQHGKITGKGEYFYEQKLIGKGLWNDGILVKPLVQGDQFTDNMITIRDITNDSNQCRQSSLKVHTEYKKDNYSFNDSLGKQIISSQKKVKFGNRTQGTLAEQSSMQSKSDDHKTAHFNQNLDTNEDECDDNQKTHSNKQNNQFFKMLLGGR